MRKHLNIFTLAAAVLLTAGPSAAADSDLTRLVKRIQPAVVTVIVYDAERHISGSARGSSSAPRAT